MTNIEMAIRRLAEMFGRSLDSVTCSMIDCSYCPYHFEKCKGKYLDTETRFDGLFEELFKEVKN